jgi:hypothetical protein
VSLLWCANCLSFYARNRVSLSFVSIHLLFGERSSPCLLLAIADVDVLLCHIGVKADLSLLRRALAGLQSLTPSRVRSGRLGLALLALRGRGLAVPVSGGRSPVFAAWLAIKTRGPVCER